MKKFNAFLLPLLLTVLLLFSGSASIAYAHAGLITTDPGKGNVVASAPKQLSLTFSEALEPGLVNLKLYDRNGERIDLPKPTLTPGKPEQMNVALPALEEGTYTVVWSIVAEDGHPVSESYTFSVGQATNVFPPSDQLTETKKKTFDLLMILLRYGVEGLILISTGFYCMTLFATRIELPGTRALLGRKTRILWALLLLGTIAEWFTYAARLPDLSLTESLFNGSYDLVLQSRFAVMVLTQLGLLLLLALPSMMPVWHALVWLALVINFALGGHAWGVTPLSAAFTSRILHLLSIAAWMGGLAYLLLTMLYGRADAAKLNHSKFRRFFLGVVITSTILVVITGIWMGLLQVGVNLLLQVAPFWNQLLYLKVGLLAIMLILALFQTLRWQREQGSLNYNLLRFELLIGVLIVQLGIWMSQIPYPIPYPIP